MGSPLVDKQFVRLLDDRLEKDFYGGYDAMPDIRDKFFDVVKSKKAWLEYYGVGAVPDPVEFSGQRSYQEVAPGYHTKIEPKEFAGGLIVQRRLIDTERYDVISDWANELGVAARRKMNKIAHEPFFYMDSSAFTYMISEEGVALCSNSHTTKTNAATTTGFDNLSTLPLNAVNLEALRIQSLGFKNDIGEIIPTNFDTIVHPASLSEKVYEITNSSGKVDEMTNNANFQKGRWKSIELPLWDDEDTNNWAIVDSRMMKKCLKWHEGVPLEFGNTTDFDTEMRKYGTYFVCGWGFKDWRWIVGSTVS